MTSRYGDSSVIEDFVLDAHGESLEIRIILDWREKSRLLKLRLPTLVQDPAATYEVPYGALERPADGEEEPGQRWIDVSGRIGEEMFGLAVLNDGKYGFDIRGGELGVTAVRSPIYAHHEPTSPKSGVRYQFQDQGLQRFRLALAPHRGAWSEAGLARRAAQFNQRPTVLLESAHPGPLPLVASYASIEPDHVVIGALKLAEDGDELVVRIVETAGRGARAIAKLPDRDQPLEVDIGPFEIRTFRVRSADTGGAAVETDLLERPLEAIDSNLEIAPDGTAATTA